MGNDDSGATPDSDQRDSADDSADVRDDSGDTSGDTGDAGDPSGSMDDLPDDMPDDMGGVMAEGPMGSGGSGGMFGGDSSAQGLVADVRTGDGNFMFGDDRVITNPPNWHSQESKELYQGATNNNDPSSAQTGSQDWIKQADELKEVADELYEAINELSSAWVGQGAGAAQGALAEIASSGSKAGSAAKTMGERMARQADAAADVKKMPPPEEFDQDKMLKAMLSGGPAAMADDMKDQHDKANAVKAEQVRYFNSYTNAMSDIDSSTPSFGPESIGLGSSGDSRASAPGGLGTGTVAAPGVGGADTAPTGASGQLTGGGGAQPAANAGPTGHGAHVVGSDPVPGGNTTSGTPTPPAPSPASTASTGGGHAALGGAALAGGLAAVGGGLAAGKHSGAVRKDSGELTDPEEVDESTELDAESELDDGAESASDDTELAGNESTGNPLTPSGAGQGVSGQPGAGAHPAPMGAPMGGGAGLGASGGGEEAHGHASFLIEPDPDDLFGANQATAPPVIGEWTEDEAL